MYLHHTRRLPSCLLLSQAVQVTATLNSHGKEMLSIAATLKKFQGMLIDSDIHVFTDHKNLAFDTLKMQ